MKHLSVSLFLPLLLIFAGSGLAAPTSTPAASAASATQPTSTTAPAATQSAATQSDDDVPPFSPVVQRLIDDPITTASQRIALRIFHGRWEKLNRLTLDRPRQAQLALLQYRLHGASLSDPRIDPLLAARAALRRGEPEQALRRLAQATSAPATVVRARALMQLGRDAQAVAVLTPLRDRLVNKPDSLATAPDLTAAAEAVALLARLEGRGGSDYQLAMDTFAKARQIDPLYWPTRIAEGKLLLAKDNWPDATAALTEVLSLNPHCSEAWYALGSLAAENYNFDAAEDALRQLRTINPHHLLADALAVKIDLVQHNAGGVKKILATALKRYPAQRDLLALQAAADALAYDDAAMRADLAHYDQLSPGSAEPWLVVGRYLSRDFQYDQGAAALREAIKREPNWSAPHVELGLLLMQAGRDAEAAKALARAVELDPFNRQAGNELKLVRALLKYDTIETPHFIIRYTPGVDAVLAHDMPETLEAIYRGVTNDFAAQPKRKTQIDILPNEQWFGVRITGMPEIWTIGACTGDVIAITPPRIGAHQKGTYDWSTVLRHEFTHVVTLAATNNRIPHWFTEALAVSEEPTGRSYDNCELLAWALQHDKLFALDQINYGFIRPRTPRDRPLAYAQANWMVDYITAQWGHQAILKLLDLYAKGTPDVAALQQVTGQDSKTFMVGFKRWAAKQVKQWGLMQEHPTPELRSILEGHAPAPDNRQQLEALLKANPGSADVLQMLAAYAIAHDDAKTARQAVLRYAAARPVDPWSQKKLVELDLKLGRTQEAIGSLVQLDRQDVTSGVWARQLAEIYRVQGDLERAGQAIERAIHHEPYRVQDRELAAAIALQQHDPKTALEQIKAMALIEPDRAIHQVQLAALYATMGKAKESQAAAELARKIDPHAPVERFLKSGK